MSSFGAEGWRLYIRSRPIATYIYLDVETHDALAPQPLVGEAWNRRRIGSFFHGGAAGTDCAAPAQEQIPWRGSGTDRGRVVREVVG